MQVQRGELLQLRQKVDVRYRMAVGQNELRKRGQPQEQRSSMYVRLRWPDVLPSRSDRRLQKPRDQVGVDPSDIDALQMCQRRTDLLQLSVAEPGT